jgi:NAD(P)-dependent dehydrogenase (short-subunit alcohol dehydrogenase family)
MVTALRRFEGKAAIVTGGLGGIGLAAARRLASEGAAVALIDRTVSSEAGEGLKALGAPDAVSLAVDVADEAAVREACDAVAGRFDRLDVVVNVAGVMIYKPLAELTGADWTANLGVSLMGPVHFTANAFRLMKSGGAIVNVSSIHAHQTSPLVAPYAAAKAALLALTRSTAIEGRAASIRANAVLPGAIDTEMLRESPNIKSGAEVLNPEDIGQPEDVAAAIAFLAADEAAFVTGSSFVVDGGRLAKL